MWQVVLQFLQAIGVSSLAGVIVGAGLMRWQKNKESLQGIKAANYREIVADYRKLAVDLQKIVDVGRSAVVAARVKSQFWRESPTGNEAEAQAMLVERLRSKVQSYDELSEGLEERLAHLLIHRSETQFHSYARQVDMQIGMLSVMLGVVQFDDSEERIDECSRQHDKVVEAVGNLRLIWDEWKIEAEREAAGMRLVPRFRPSRVFINRRM